MASRLSTRTNPFCFSAPITPSRWRGFGLGPANSSTRESGQRKSRRGGGSMNIGNLVLAGILIVLIVGVVFGGRPGILDAGAVAREAVSDVPGNAESRRSTRGRRQGWDGSSFMAKTGAIGPMLTLAGTKELRARLLEPSERRPRALPGVEYCWRMVQREILRVLPETVRRNSLARPASGPAFPGARRQTME